MSYLLQGADRVSPLMGTSEVDCALSVSFTLVSNLSFKRSQHCLINMPGCASLNDVESLENVGVCLSIWAFH